MRDCHCPTFGLRHRPSQCAEVNARGEVSNLAERNAVKPRTCRTCSQEILTTAAGIQTHAKTCKERPAWTNSEVSPAAPSSEVSYGQS